MQPFNFSFVNNTKHKESTFKEIYNQSKLIEDQYSLYAQRHCRKKQVW